MTHYTLSRSGHAPLVFIGEKIAESEGNIDSECQRWHDIALYRTVAGKYVVSIEYSTLRKGECGHSFAAVCQDIDEVKRYLAAYDPIARVRGWPPLPRYADRQRQLLADIRQAWEQQLSELLDALPEAAENVA